MRRFYGYSFVMLVVVLLYFVCCVSYAQAKENTFPLKDGDVWVMAGDSITAQHLHSNYFEAFCYARFPNLKFCFRNSGVGGDTIPRTLARFEWDIEAWKPTVVSVELGMNDSGAGPTSTAKYISNMNTLVERIKKIGAKPVLFTSSPVNDGMSIKTLKGRNLTLDLYSSALEEFAKTGKIPFANQFHTLIDLWGSNKPVERLIVFSEIVKASVSMGETPGKELLEQWLERWEKSDIKKKGINLGGNPVHPGEVGQIMMSTMLLKGLNAPGLVSNASIDFSGKVIEELKCSVTNVKTGDTNISFDRLDESLPMPIPDSCRSALTILPYMEDLSLWILTIKNVKPGNYSVSIDGTTVAIVSADKLEKGWNMGLLETGPVAEQCKQILELVSAKEKLVSQWRIKAKVSGQKETDEMKNLREKILAADEKIRIAAKPQIRHFVIVRQ